MDATKKKGTMNVLGSYIAWGLLPAFWNLLSEVNSMYILAQRVIWSLLCLSEAAAAHLLQIRENG